MNLNNPPTLHVAHQKKGGFKTSSFFFFACSVISHKKSLKTCRGRKVELGRRLGRTQRTATREKEAQNNFFPPCSFEARRSAFAAFPSLVLSRGGL